MSKNKNFKKGFTLVEMLVAIAVFMMVVTVAMSALMSIINANRKARAIQSVVSNVNFVVESISRDIRMGSGYYCGTVQDGTDCSTGIGSQSINYLSPDGITKVYYYFTPPTESEKGFLSKCTLTEDSCDVSGNTLPAGYARITSPDTNILSLKFYVVKGSDVQPKVIIMMEGQAGGLTDTKSTFNLQTTASQRAIKK
ncbi:MAG: type II secretion system protein [Minisyncoccia bacterium]